MNIGSSRQRLRNGELAVGREGCCARAVCQRVFICGLDEGIEPLVLGHIRELTAVSAACLELRHRQAAVLGDSDHSLAGSDIHKGEFLLCVAGCGRVYGVSACVCNRDLIHTVRSLVGNFEADIRNRDVTVDLVQRDVRHDKRDLGCTGKRLCVVGRIDKAGILRRVGRDGENIRIKRQIKLRTDDAGAVFEHDRDGDGITGLTSSTADREGCVACRKCGQCERADQHQHGKNNGNLFHDLLLCLYKIIF